MNYVVKTNTAIAGFTSDEREFPSLGAASFGFVTRIRQVAETLEDGCDGSEDGFSFCRRCVWCRASRKAREQAAPARGTAARIEVALTGASAAVIDVPNDEPVIVWIDAVGYNEEALAA